MDSKSKIWILISQSIWDLTDPDKKKIEHCVIADTAKDAIRSMVAGYVIKGSRVSDDRFKKESDIEFLFETVRGFDGKVPMNQNARRVLQMLLESRETEFQLDCYGLYDNKIKSEELSHEEITSVLNDLFVEYRG